MRRTTLRLALLLLASAPVVARAQGSEPSQDELKERYAKKIAEKWYTGNPWITEYDAALAKSKETGRPIVAYFTRSYAPCRPCAVMEGGLLSSDEFNAFAKKYVLYVNVTTRIDGRPGEDLLYRKGGRGFPYVAAMNAEGKVTAQLGVGGRNLEGFEALMKAAAEYEARQDDPIGSAQDVARWIRFEVRVGNISPADARKLVVIGLDEESAKGIEREIADVQIAAMLLSIRSPAETPDVGKKLAVMMRDGQVPTDSEQAEDYYEAIIAYAERDGDLDALERALRALRRRAGDDERMMRYIDEKTKVLEALKAKAK